MSCGCSSSPCGCNTPNIPRGPRGYQGPAGPAPIFEEVNVAVGPAAATITGTSPNLTLNLTIPPGTPGTPGAPGAPGAAGQAPFAALTAQFVQPNIGNPVNVTGPAGAFNWAAVGEPVFIENGGKYTVGQVLSAGSVLKVVNDGGAGNAVAGTIIPSASLVSPTGRDGVAGTPGAAGAPGAPGLPGVIEVVNTIPVAAPAPNKTFVIYTDSTFNPTVITGYSWNLVSWVPTVNLTPAAGSQIFSTIGVPGSGTGKNGDWAFDSVTLEVYYKTAGTWTNPFDLSANFTQVATTSGGDMGTVPVRTPRIVGFDPLAVTHSAPGTYTLDLQYQAFAIKANKDITLDWSSASFTYSGVWEVQIENVDASPIDITIAAAAWAENASLALTFPISLAAGDIRVFVLRKPMAGGRMIIENTYLLSNLP